MNEAQSQGGSESISGLQAESLSQALKLYKEMPIKGIRKLIASRLSRVWHEAVHVTLHKDVDVTYFYANKANLKHSLIDYVLYGLVQTLKEESFLAFNGHFNGEMLQTFASINLGLATDHPRGLLVPVLHGAEEMAFDEFISNRKSLVNRAKAWKQTPQELENGTFTVTNLGMMGIDYFTPIINPPQVAILGLGRVRVETISWDWAEAPTPKALLPFSLTIDHRILDGADAARFMQSLEAFMLELGQSTKS
jgi:pyruvate dehydrogenase E2 component (dihydrolipoamide acetyltransferase)